MDDFEPLPADVLQVLLSLPLGERIRRLRLLRGKSQRQVLDELERRNQKRSGGWLSSLESGSIALKEDLAAHVGVILELLPQEMELLRDGAGAVGDDLIRYTAWQSVRLFLAETYFHKMDGTDRAKAQAAQRDLRSAFDDPTGHASQLKVPDWDVHNLKGSVSRLVLGEPGGPVARALPTHVRWMLLIEGLYMDPYRPFSPGVWSKDAPNPTMEALAGALALDREREPDMWSTLLGIRRHRFADPTRYLRSHEPVAQPRARPGVPAVGAVLHGETALDVLAGGAEVGEFGWAFAVGKHLLDVDATLTTLPPRWTPAAMRRRLPAGAEPSELLDDARVARLIWATGTDQLRSDLAKLRSMSVLADTFSENSALARFQKENAAAALTQLWERGRIGRAALTRWNNDFHAELTKNINLIKKYSH